jgi:hypothetical protein
LNRLDDSAHTKNIGFKVETKKNKDTLSAHNTHMHTNAVTFIYMCTQRICFSQCPNCTPTFIPITQLHHQLLALQNPSRCQTEPSQPHHAEVIQQVKASTPAAPVALYGHGNRAALSAWQALLLELLLGRWSATLVQQQLVQLCSRPARP